MDTNTQNISEETVNTITDRAAEIFRMKKEPASAMNYTVNDIAEHTAVSVQKIRRYLNEYSDYISRGKMCRTVSGKTYYGDRAADFLSCLITLKDDFHLTHAAIRDGLDMKLGRKNMSRSSAQREENLEYIRTTLQKMIEESDAHHSFFRQADAENRRLLNELILQNNELMHKVDKNTRSIAKLQKMITKQKKYSLFEKYLKQLNIR